MPSSPDLPRPHCNFELCAQGFESLPLNLVNCCFLAFSRELDNITSEKTLPSELSQPKRPYKFGP